MFGYVKPYKPDLKFCEFDIYQAVYCGLCKELGHSYSRLAPLTLNYDLTFLALLGMSLRPKSSKFSMQVCNGNPLKKKNCLSSCDDLSFSAAAAMSMVYHKLMDDFHDSGFWGKGKTLFLLPFAKRIRKKSIRAYPEIDKIIAHSMERQAAVEQDPHVSVDRAADPTAEAMGQICQMLGQDETQKRVLYQLGYLIGRWVYLMDALDDLEKDQKHHNFNPYLLKVPRTKTETDLKEIKDYVTGIIHITTAQIAAAYELLDIKQYKVILDNIIYLGLKNTLKMVLEKGEKKKYAK